jgi:hypothetical protein
MSDQQQNQQGGWATGWRRSAEAQNRTTRLLFGEFSFLPRQRDFFFACRPESSSASRVTTAAGSGVQPSKLFNVPV